jgi:hypothetical protein
LAFATGGSLDYRISDHVSYRVLQPELLWTRFRASPGDDGQIGLRLSSGLVWRW